MLGEPLNPPPADAGMGSTDMGDVTHAVPGIHAYIQICGEEVAGHSLEFAKASISKRGQEAMLTAAKALAMTAVDLFTDPKAVRQIKEEFQLLSPTVADRIHQDGRGDNAECGAIRDSCP